MGIGTDPRVWAMNDYILPAELISFIEKIPGKEGRYEMRRNNNNTDSQ